MGTTDRVELNKLHVEQSNERLEKWRVLLWGLRA